MCSKEVEATSHAVKMQKRMQLHWQNEELCDVVLIAGVGGKRIPAHRLVLSASSDYFSTMFCGPLVDVSQHEVTLGEVNGNDLQTLLHWCYTGNISIDEDDVQTLLQAATMLQLDGVIAACAEFLMDQLELENCLDIALYAEQLNCGTLLQKVNAFICEHFAVVREKEKFLELDVEQLAKIIGSDDLVAPSEESVFNSVISWIKHDPELREQHLARLLKLVRLTSLPFNFIVEHIKPICESPDSLKLLLESVLWQVLPGRRTETTLSEQSQPRKSLMGALVALGYDDNDVKIEKYCPRTSKWTFWKIYSASRSYFNVAVSGDKLFIMGGYRNYTTLNTCEYINIKTNAVTTMSSMECPRYSFGTDVIDNLLYVVGGCSRNIRFEAVERYNPLNDTWTELTPMSCIRSAAGVVALDGLLYAIGGYNGSEYLNSMECYDPKTNKWTPKASMSCPRSLFGVVAASGYIYVIGGRTKGIVSLDTVERYETSTNRWTQLSSMSAARSQFGCALLSGRIIAVGGLDNNSQKLNTVEEYDIKTNKWSQGAPLNDKTVHYICAKSISSLPM